MTIELPDEAKLILSTVCGDISIEKLLSRDRTQPLPYKRKIAVYLIRRETGMNTTVLSRLFNFSTRNYVSTIITEIHGLRNCIPEVNEDVTGYEKILKQHYQAAVK